MSVAILHDLPIRAPRAAVFAGFTTPRGLDEWWTLRAAGVPEVGAEYTLFFGPGYDWRSRVRQLVAETEFELEMTRADADWTATRVSVRLAERDGMTWVHFAHTGWREANEHFRITNHCWGLYLRLLRRWLEAGETVPYERRLEV